MTHPNAQTRYVIVDDTPYAIEGGGRMFWCGHSWSRSTHDVVIYPTIKAANETLEGWRRRAKADAQRLGIAYHGSAADNSTVHDWNIIRAISAIYSATFRATTEATIALGYSRDVARATGREVAQAAVDKAYPSGSLMDLGDAPAEMPDCYR